jgi:hypothetical protein
MSLDHGHLDRLLVIELGLNESPLGLDRKSEGESTGDDGLENEASGTGVQVSQCEVGLNQMVKHGSLYARLKRLFSEIAECG